MKGTDAAVLSEYEEELQLYEAELQKERELACAELFVKAKAAKAQEQAELVGYLKEPGACCLFASFVVSRTGWKGSPLHEAAATSLLQLKWTAEN